jgi:hypothetical protein
MKTLAFTKTLIFSSTLIFVAFFSLFVTLSYGIEKDELLRFNSNRTVEVTVAFLNPLLKDSKNTLQFEVSINTHTGNLSKFDPDKHAYLQIGNGMLHRSIAWKDQERDSHHISGILKFVGPVPPSSKKIQLFIHDLGGINKREFMWLLPISRN